MKSKQNILDSLVDKERRKLNHRKEKLKRIMDSIKSYNLQGGGRVCRKHTNATAFSI